MDVHELLIDLFGRVDGHVRNAVEGLDADLSTLKSSLGA